MAASNRCQAKGLVGEKQEYLFIEKRYPFHIPTHPPGANNKHKLDKLAKIPVNEYLKSVFRKLMKKREGMLFLILAKSWIHNAKKKKANITNETVDVWEKKNLLLEDYPICLTL